MNVKLKMDKAHFTAFYKWLNLMSTSVTPDMKSCVDSFLEENKAVFDKINDEEFALTEKGQGKLEIGDVVRISKRNVFNDRDVEYVVVNLREGLNYKKFGLLPLDHIMDEALIKQNKTARAWRWFNHFNIRYVRVLTESEKAIFNQWKLSRARKKALEEKQEVTPAQTMFDLDD